VLRTVFTVEAARGLEIITMRSKHCWKRLLLSYIVVIVGIAPILSSTSNGGELGDEITSDESRDIFFASLDNNGNGKISVDELTGYIEDTGGNSLDEKSEIQSALSSVLKTLDLNEDKVLKKDDFAIYWKSLCKQYNAEIVDYF
jgi:hypothetical protein